MCTKFGTAEGVADVITCDNFLGDRLRGVDSVGSGVAGPLAAWCGGQICRPIVLGFGNG